LILFQIWDKRMVNWRWTLAARQWASSAIRVLPLSCGKLSSHLGSGSLRPLLLMFLLILETSHGSAQFCNLVKLFHCCAFLTLLAGIYDFGYSAIFE
jgi:hypothetical protein